MAGLQRNLDEFYGPYLQVSNTNALLASDLKAGKPANFRILLLMLEDSWPTQISGPEKALVDEIIRNDAALDALIRKQAGLVDDKLQPYLWRASAHFRMIQLIHRGKLSGAKAEADWFDSYVYPKALDDVLKLEVQRLQERIATLRDKPLSGHPPLQSLQIPSVLSRESRPARIGTP
jgi:hypothetical protein